MSDLTLTRPQIVSTGRQTRPAHYSPYSAGGIGVIPRRDVCNVALINSRTALATYAPTNALRLLWLLSDVHPTLSAQKSNVLGLLCQADALKIVGVKESGPGAGDDRTDDGGTAILDDLFKSQPPEVGGLDGLYASFIEAVLFTAMPCLEAVPGKRGEGVKRLWSVDGLTIGLSRETVDSDITAKQRQNGAPLGWSDPLNPLTFRWSGFGATPDYPYGVPLYAAALPEVLEDFGLTRDMRDVVHNVAWPRYSAGFDWEQAITYVKTAYPNYTEQQVFAAVVEFFTAFRTAFENKKADDNFIASKGCEVAVLEGGKGFSNLPAVTERFDRRLVQALKTRPVFLGYNDSTTETQAREQFKIEAAVLERVRAFAVAPLVWAANLHFRLLGLNLTAKAEYEPIRTVDAMLEAQAEQLQIANAIAKREQGWITNEQASMEITGSGPVSEPIALPPAVAPANPNAPNNGNPPPGE